MGNSRINHFSNDAWHSALEISQLREPRTAALNKQISHNY